MFKSLTILHLLTGLTREALILGPQKDWHSCHRHCLLSTPGFPNWDANFGQRNLCCHCYHCQCHQCKGGKGTELLFSHIWKARNDAFLKYEKHRTFVDVRIKQTIANPNNCILKHRKTATLPWTLTFVNPLYGLGHGEECEGVLGIIYSETH